MKASRSVDFGDLIMRPTLLLEGDEGGPDRPFACVTAMCWLMNTRTSIVQAPSSSKRLRVMDAVYGSSATLANRSTVFAERRRSIWVASPSEYPECRRSTAFRSITVRARKSFAAFTAVAPHMAASEGMLPLALESNNGASGISPATPLFRNHRRRNGRYRGKHPRA